MGTYGQTVRRGLPRRPGGEPWPPAGASPTATVAEPVDEAVPAGVTASVLPAAVTEASAEGLATSEVIAPTAERTAPTGTVPSAPASPAAVGGARVIRRGLPRVAGGEPWPRAESTTGAVHVEPSTEAAVGAVAAAATVASSSAPPAAPVAPVEASAAAAPPSRQSAVADSAQASPPSDGAKPLRRGLPRVPGGDPWPPAGPAPAAAPLGVAAAPTDVTAPFIDVTAVEPATRQEPAVVETALVPATADVSTPLPFTRTVFPGRAAVVFERERLAGTLITAPEPKKYGPLTRLQWAGLVIVGGAGLLFAAGMAVLAVRFLLSLEPFQEFLTAYPGEYPLPEGAPVGIPPWLGWQHFFNVFLMVLIIRSGLQVRTEKRPTAFWSPRGNEKRKISLNLWFHQSLDILWIVNGVIFIVLLFATGQWMKLVPTSWAVFPNAISAALQYVSLDWPTENGWVNYNSLQQLAYFATVFLAAPLAIATGVRMSGIWPKNAKTLNRIYPIEIARAIHFPVMLYFVAFIIVHVALVFATGALRNLNHMYASQDVINWVGFWIFTASMVVIIAGWIAARPLVLAPIARVFGKVSGR
ncbi:Thiosulfate reductase cytochrome b subunit [Microbacterium sp. cf046]|uniref:cytochrome b/b6 domain-containing protein n=1 Tax=Microbacterium sp. cf046 TaxID=1761803 RepID=UPI0008F082C6|nr:cytochrome b/b6 domain-containing protein [Microbacterium sp. cf046]SFS13532.1 Thiosulfate reductase cytochrome b subunit [Microbacterium sp. cf046]